MTTDDRSANSQALAMGATPRLLHPRRGAMRLAGSSNSRSNAAVSPESPAAIQPSVAEQTVVRVHMVNSGAVCQLVLQTPGGALRDEGDTAIDGVPGSAAPIICNYLDIAGSNCGSLLPTGRAVDRVEGVQVTCVDNGMPVVVLRAADFGLTGAETPAKLDANEVLKAQLETIRILAGPKMNLGDLTGKPVPKMCLISPPRHGGLVMTRTFIPQVCHRSIGALGAVSTATARLLRGSVAEELGCVPQAIRRSWRSNIQAGLSACNWN